MEHAPTHNEENRYVLSRNEKNDIIHKIDSFSGPGEGTQVYLSQAEKCAELSWSGLRKTRDELLQIHSSGHAQPADMLALYNVYRSEKSRRYKLAKFSTRMAHIVKRPTN